VDYRWNDWNVGHIADHGISPADAESIVEKARRPYPQIIGNNKRLVLGQTEQGSHIQVIYVLDDDGVAYVIHARPMTDREKRRYRRRIK
jgi:uncharacterized DUF497 family protein